MGLVTKSRTFTVASGGTTGVVELEEWDTLGLIIPSMTSTTLKLQVSHDGATPKDIYDGTGTQVLNWTAGTFDRAVASRDMADVAGYRYLHVSCGTAQGAEKTFRLTWKAPKRL